MKWLFFPVFSIMVMLKQSSLSAFSLLWKTSSSGFLSLDQVSLYPWISSVTFHCTGDAWKTSLIWCSYSCCEALQRQQYFSFSTRNASQAHPPIAFAFFHGCITLPVSHLATHTPSLTSSWLVAEIFVISPQYLVWHFILCFHPIFITQVSKSSVLVVLNRFASLTYVNAYSYSLWWGEWKLMKILKLISLVLRSPITKFLWARYIPIWHCWLHFALS